MVGSVSRPWKANLWCCWYNCFVLFCLLYVHVRLNGTKYSGHVWTQRQFKNAFLLTGKSLGSNSVTAIVFHFLFFLLRPVISSPGRFHHLPLEQQQMMPIMCLVTLAKELVKDQSRIYKATLPVGAAVFICMSSFGLPFHSFLKTYTHVCFLCLF